MKNWRVLWKVAQKYGQKVYGSLDWTIVEPEIASKNLSKLPPMVKANANIVSASSYRLGFFRVINWGCPNKFVMLHWPKWFWLNPGNPRFATSHSNPIRMNLRRSKFVPTSPYSNLGRPDPCPNRIRVDLNLTRLGLDLVLIWVEP